jgi:hypothetical protein
MKTIHVESMVASRDGMPFVVLKWGDERGQLTPDEAREHAHLILEAADAAESDAFIFKFVTEKIQIPEQAAQILLEFRKFRDQLKEKAIQ